jgi:ATP-binding cassette subfamily F protein uup
VGIVGVNGAGKTSVLRLLAGELSPTGGRVKRGRTVALAHLPQDASLPTDDPDARVLGTIEGLRRVTRTAAGGEVTATALLERFGFTGDRLTARLSDLSGGERRRFQLLRLLLSEPNVLLLDEPTNDLDIDTLTVLEDFLDSWPGTLVVVSHDRYFLERVTDTTRALLADGQVALLPGGVDEYLARRASAVAASEPAPASAPAPSSGGKPGSAEERTARKTIARLDRQLERIAEQEAALNAEMAAQASDHEALAGLSERLRALAEEKEALEREWLEAAEILG